MDCPTICRQGVNTARNNNSLHRRTHFDELPNYLPPGRQHRSRQQLIAPTDAFKHYRAGRCCLPRV